MHAKLDIRFVFDEATVDGETIAEKKAHLEQYLNTVAEQIADMVGMDSVYTGYNSVDEVTHEVKVSS